MKISFHPAARRELLKHSRWYQERSESAASGFEREIEHAVGRIQEAWERYRLTRRGRRRFVMLTYPFDLIYRVGENEIEIIAVAHHSRVRSTGRTVDRAHNKLGREHPRNRDGLSSLSPYSVM